MRLWKFRFSNFDFRPFLTPDTCHLLYQRLPFFVRNA
jgi:hypothetical protein